MEYGIQLATSAHHWKVVKRAEELGFTHAWFYDTHLLNAEVFVAMGAAAVTTSKIKLCTGVLIPSNRIAPVAASALASLNALAPGRIDLGPRTGFTGRRTMGLPAITLARLEEYLRVVRGAAARRDGRMVGRGRHAQDPLPQSRERLHQHRRPDPGAYLGLRAARPRSRRQARHRLDLGRRQAAASGRRARSDEEILDRRGPRREGPLFHDLRRRLRPAAGRGGRQPARQGAGRADGHHGVPRFRRGDELGSIAKPLPFLKPLYDRYREIYKSYEPADARYLTNHRGHLMFLRPEEQQLLSADLIRNMTMTGPQDELVEGVKAFKAAGFSQLAIHLRNGHEMEMLEDWAKVIEKAA